MSKSYVEKLQETYKAKWLNFKEYKGENYEADEGSTAHAYPDEFLYRGELQIEPHDWCEQPPWNGFSVTFAGVEVIDHVSTLSGAVDAANHWLQEQLLDRKIPVPKTYRHYKCQNPNKIFEKRPGILVHQERDGDTWHLIFEVVAER